MSSSQKFLVDYFNQSCSFDTGVSNLDFFKEQLQACSLEISALTKALAEVLAMGGNDTDIPFGVAEDIQCCILEGRWPPSSLSEVVELSDVIEPLMGALQSSQFFSRNAINNCFDAVKIIGGVYSADAIVKVMPKLLNTAAKQANSARPCRFGGACRTVSCAFDHDLSDRPCSFWLHSADGCAKPACLFAHSGYFDGLLWRMRQRVPSNDSVQRSAAEDLHPFSFHFLLGSLTIESEPEPEPDALASTLQLQLEPKSGGFENSAQEFEFPSLPHAEAPAKQRASPSVADTLSGKFQYKSRPAAAEVQKPSVFVGLQAQPAQESVKYDVTTSSWIEGGANVAMEYAQFREPAAALVAQRHALAERSKAAYLAGKGKEARELSLQAQEVGQELKEAQESAAKSIFARRNSDATLGKGQIDLHGLHVEEATQMLHEVVPSLLRSGLTKVLIVTGTGHHSAARSREAPKLGPAVLEYCSQLNCKVRSVRMDGHVGGYEITI